MTVLLEYLHLSEDRFRGQDYLYNHFVTTVAYDNTETVPQLLAIILNFSDDG